MHYSNYYRPPLLLTFLLLSLLCLPATCLGARILVFGVEEAQGYIAITASGTPVMRFRQSAISPQIANRISSSLNQAALRGVRPGAVVARKSSGGAVILIGSETLLEINAKLAASANSTPLGLAQTWASNIQKAFANTYVAFATPIPLLVPLGESRSVSWGGTITFSLQVNSTNPLIAAANVATSPRRVIVNGLNRGPTEVVITGEGFEFRLPVEVKPWAATVSPQVTGEITSPPLPADDLRRILRNAVLAGVRPMPGASIQLAEPVRTATGYQLTVRASGPDCLDVITPVNVQLTTITPQLAKAPELVVSNYPERIREPATLLRDHLRHKVPLRVLWHHVSNFSQPLRFAVRMANLGSETARVHITESGSGPHFDEIFVGHQAMVRYLSLSARGEGFVISIPPGRMADLYDVRLNQGDIVSGIAQLSPLQGGDLMVEVVAENAWPTDAYFMPVPAKIVQDAALTPYRFEANKSGEVTHDVGGAWGFHHIGRGASTNLQGKELFGDYGVLYDVKAMLANNTDRPANAEIVVRAGGGVARGTFIIDGRIVETGLLQAGNEEILLRQPLLPSTQQSFRIRTIPQSGSNYPLTIILRSWQQQ
jgi:hypothetical protein